MKLDDFTQEVLKNFSDIQPNVVIHPGKEIKTLSESRNIMARVTLNQEFPNEVRIYDLKEFLGVLRLLDSPDITFHETHVLVADGVGRSRIKYFFADGNTLTVPAKDIAMPKAEVMFELDEKTLNSIRSASAALGHEKFTVKKIDGTIVLTVEDVSDDTSNKYSVDVPGTADQDDFMFILTVNNMKVIPGDYTVSMSSKRISKFKHKTHDLEYWIALDKDSVYNV